METYLFYLFGIIKIIEFLYTYLEKLFFYKGNIFAKSDLKCLQKIVNYTILVQTIVTIRKKKTAPPTQVK